MATGALSAEIEVNSYRSGRDFVTEGGVDRVTWYQAGVAIMSDYANYNEWALAGLDGKDPVSATFWENFEQYIYSPPSRLTLKYLLRLPWPLGTYPSEAKFLIDETQLANNQITLTLTDQPAGVEAASLMLSAVESPSNPGEKMVRFRVTMRFTPIIELLLDAKGLNEHITIIVKSLAANLENYALARYPSGTP